MSFGKHLRIYLVSLLLAATLLAGFNALVDPYGLFGTPRIEGFNERKPAAINRTRLYKPYEVLKAMPRTLVVGNSRPEMGIDPESACWPEAYGPVYSLTFPGLNAYSQVRALFHGIAGGDVRHVVLALDFADLLYARERGPGPVSWPGRNSEFHQRLRVDEALRPDPGYRLAKLRDMAGALFSLDTLFDSLHTVATQSADSPTRTPLGFNPARDYFAIIRHEGQWVLFRQKLAELQARFAPDGMGIHDTDDRWSLELEGVKRAIEAAAERDISLTLLINPYHVSYLETIRETGYWDAFEDFKRSLNGVVQRHGEGKVALWDFALYSPYTVTPIPGPMDGDILRWFWEPAHYRAELGDVMLAQMFGRDCPETDRDRMPGVRLDRVDIEVHLRRQNEARTRLFRNPALMRYDSDPVSR